MKKLLLSGLVFAAMSSAALAAEPLTEDRLDAVTAGCLRITLTHITGSLSSTTGLTATFTTFGDVFLVGDGQLRITSTPIPTSITGSLSSTKGLTATFTTPGDVFRVDGRAAAAATALSERAAGDAPPRSSLSTRPDRSLMTALHSEASDPSRSEGSRSGRAARAESHRSNARDEGRSGLGQASSAQMAAPAGPKMARLYNVSQPTVSRVVAQHRLASP